MDQEKRIKRFKNIHAKVETPWPAIARTLEREIGINPTKEERILEGEVNEVYRISDGRSQYILRIASLKEGHFRKEEWAKTKCREMGVPVANTIKISKIILEDGSEREYALDECVTGKAAAPEIWQESLGKWASTLKEAGKYLGRIHKVRVDGFGYTDKEGKGDYGTFQEFVREDKLNEAAEGFYLKVAKEIPREGRLIKEAFRVFQENILKYPQEEAVLVHSDFQAKHFMVDEYGKIKAILDFGECKGGAPEEDFARWEFWNGPSLPISLLQAAYENKSLFSKDFEAKVLLHKLWQGLDKVYDFYINKEFKFLAKMAKEMGEDAKRFKRLS